ncbi:hypothetical protein JCM10212_002423 [Sporobolomyces blumeae]
MPALPRQGSTGANPSIPTAFRVATSSSPRSSRLDSATYAAFHSHAATRALDHAAPSSLAVKLDWIERLSGPSVDVETLKLAAPHLDQTSYDDLLEERHLEGWCPYAACGNRASVPYAATAATIGQRFKLNGGALFDANAARQDKGAFCSVRCKARSEWYRTTVGKDIGGDGAMLEDVEKRREQVRASTKEIIEQGHRHERGTQDGLAAGRGADKAQAKEAFATDLLSTLTIHEKATSTEPPLAPNPDAAKIDFERPAPTVASSKRSTRFPSDPAACSAPSRPLAGSASALLPFATTSLGRTVLASTRQSPASHPPAPPANRQPTTGAFGLPPVRFVSEPRMVDSRGREIEWEDNALEDQEISDEVRGLLDEALEVRRMVERGEL